MGCFGLIGNVGPWELMFLFGLLAIVIVVVIIVAVTSSSNKPPMMNQGIPIPGPGQVQAGGYCRQCGSRLDADSLFCSKCGTPV